jgi:hypothetical protein
MPERRPSLRDRLARRRPEAVVRREVVPAVPPADAAAAAALAQDASTPFGYRRPARELLEPFGGLGAEGRGRATAALSSVGIAAEPALADAEPFQFVHLRRVEAAVHTPHPVVDPAAAPPAAAEEPAAAAPPAAAPPAPAAEPEPARPEPARPAAQRVAARFAPTAPVPRDRRVAAGALGLAALVVLIVAVVLLRGIGGEPGSAARALPADEPQAAAPPSTRTAPARTVPAGATTPGRSAAPRATTPDTPGTTGATSPPQPARKTVTLRVVPTQTAYVCIADGGGRTLWEGMLTGPYVARRSKLVLRVGVATAKITANGRPVRVTKAPGAFELTPGAIRELPGDARVCGG